MGRWIAVLLWGLGASAWAQVPGRFTKLGDEVVAEVRGRFFDAKKAAEWAEHHKAYAASAKSDEDFARLTRQVLADLQTSHTEYYARDTLGYVGLSTVFRWVLKPPKPEEYVSMGVDVAEQPEGLFVRHVFPGGPADKAGLLRGDRIVSVEGQPYEPVLSLKSRAGKPTRVTVVRAKGQAPLTLTVTPRLIDPKAEWLEVQAKSSRVIERAGKRVAYQYMYACAGTEFQDALAEYILYRLEDADSLVVDFRDGWGGCNPEFLNLFNKNLPVLTSVDRAGKQQTMRPAWLKPVVLLVNGNSRSGKEVVSFAMKQRGMAVLVGQRTAGAVMAGAPVRLSNGDLLYVATMDVAVDGTRLEGTGVAVDFEVPDALPYAAGKDPQLEKALDVAASLRPAATPAEGLK